MLVTLPPSRPPQACSTTSTDARAGSLTARVVGLTVGAAVFAWSAVSAAAPVPDSFSALAEKVMPAVVTITAEKTVEVSATPYDSVPRLPMRSPLDRFLRQFGGGHEASRSVTALGSGFLIDADGYVVTNNHVIEGAANISIALSGGEHLKADLVGTDPDTDVALLKVEADHPLPFVPFGDSDALKVGDWVMAVGNPFGLGGTVTAGIVSARGREIDAGPFDDFIQTDASINKGNSGGPMFATDGTVVGINTAIYSPNGGSVGIGFAVPASLAKPVIAQLRATGQVERGWLGVAVQSLTPDAASALGLDDTQGVLVASVEPDSPASKAGLRPGDVILEAGQEAVTSPRELARVIAGHKPGSDIHLAALREGDQTGFIARLGTAERQGQEPAVAQAAPLGLAVTPVDAAWRQRLGLEDDAHGLVVTAVAPGSPAAEQGFRPGDLVLQVNRHRVDRPEDLRRAVTAARDAGRRAVLVLVQRGDVARFVTLPTAQA